MGESSILHKMFAKRLRERAASPANRNDPERQQELLRLAEQYSREGPQPSNPTSSTPGNDPSPDTGSPVGSPMQFAGERLVQDDERRSRELQQGADMEVTRAEWDAIVQGQQAGTLTILIDTPGFRRVLAGTSPTNLSEIVGCDVSVQLSAIRLLTVAPTLTLLVASAVAVLAFGWWSMLVIPSTVVGVMAYQGRASAGPQSLSGVIAVVLGAAGVAILAPDWNLALRAFVVLVALSIFVARLTYVFTSRFVFRCVDSSYEFFRRFYLKPVGATVPMIWTRPEGRGE